jgi:hypothetical protein
MPGAASLTFIHFVNAVAPYNRQQVLSAGVPERAIFAYAFL